MIGKQATGVISYLVKKVKSPFGFIETDGLTVYFNFDEYSDDVFTSPLKGAEVKRL